MADETETTVYNVTRTHYVSAAPGLSWPVSTVLIYPTSFTGPAIVSTITLTTTAPSWISNITPQTITFAVTIGPTGAVDSNTKTVGIGKSPATIRTNSTASVPTSDITTSTQVPPPGTSSSPQQMSSVGVPTSASLASSSASAGRLNTVSSTISPGALTGTAIGCAIAGATFATILACFIKRRRRRFPSSLSLGPSMRDRPELNGMGAPDTMEMALTKFNTQSTMDDLLPPPMQSKDLADIMRSLGTSIKNHAHSYYGGADALTIGQASSQLSSLLGTSPPIATKALSSLMSNPLYKVKAIRFLLAWSILRNVDSSSSPEQTLLPRELAGCMDTMNSQSNEALRSALMSKWRQMSAALMQSNYGGGDISPDDRRQRNIQDLVEALDTVLAPVASKRTNGERRQNLEDLVKKGAHLAYVIFTLPTKWEFDWQHPEGQRKGELVVFPALVQVSDDQGRLPLTEIQTASAGKTGF